MYLVYPVVSDLLPQDANSITDAHVNAVHCSTAQLPRPVASLPFGSHSHDSRVTSRYASGLAFAAIRLEPLINKNSDGVRHDSSVTLTYINIVLIAIRA